MTYAFIADGIPKGQPRARAFAMKGKGGKYTARMYDAGTAEGWKQAVVVAGDTCKPKSPITVPVELELSFYMPRPLRLKKPNSPHDPIPFVSKPDADNLAKAVMDAMTVAGWWVDDCQVVELSVRKSYSYLNGRSGVAVRVTEIVD